MVSVPLPADDNGVVRYEQRFEVDLSCDEKHLPALERELADFAEERKKAALQRLLLHKPKKGIGEATMRAFLADVLLDVREFCAKAVERACEDIRRLRHYPSFPESAELREYCTEWQRAMNAARDLLHRKNQALAELESGLGISPAHREKIEAVTSDPRIFLWLRKSRLSEDAGGVEIRCDSSFTKTWVETNYQSVLERAFAPKKITIIL